MFLTGTDLPHVGFRITLGAKHYAPTFTIFKGSGIFLHCY